MDDRRDVYDSLIDWLKILDLSAPCGSSNSGESSFQLTNSVLSIFNSVSNGLIKWSSLG